MASVTRSNTETRYLSEAFVCIVPCKLANRRLPDKNVKPFYRGLSLLDIKLRQLTELLPRNRIIVASDDARINDFLSDKGVGCAVSPTRYTGRADDLLEFYRGIIPSIESHSIMTSYVTTPFINQDIMLDMLHIYFSSASSTDSVVAVGRVQTKLFDARAQPFNFGLGISYRGTDQVPPLFSWIREVSILRTEVARKTGMDVGERPHLYVVNRIQAVDIDTQEDWDLATNITYGADGCRLLGLGADAPVPVTRNGDTTASG